MTQWEALALYLPTLEAYECHIFVGDENENIDDFRNRICLEMRNAGYALSRNGFTLSTGLAAIPGDYSRPVVKARKLSKEE